MNPLTETYRKTQRLLSRRDPRLRQLMKAVGPCTLLPDPDGFKRWPAPSPRSRFRPKPPPLSSHNWERNSRPAASRRRPSWPLPRSNYARSAYRAARRWPYSIWHSMFRTVACRCMNYTTFRTTKWLRCWCRFRHRSMDRGNVPYFLDGKTRRSAGSRSGITRGGPVRLRSAGPSGSPGSD